MKEHLTFRFAEDADQKYLVEWLLQPGVLEGFPLTDLREIEDAARIWVGYSKYEAVLTALWDGVPCGIAVLYLQPYQKLAHQCLFAIIVDEKYRGKGVGDRLMKELMALGKEKFKLEFIHLEVYEGNRAINLYRKLGFKEYGFQRHFIKETYDGKSRYIGKILMQKYL
jgi:putative acetyltransferase